MSLHQIKIVRQKMMEDQSKFNLTK